MVVADIDGDSKQVVCKFARHRVASHGGDEPEKHLLREVGGKGGITAAAIAKGVNVPIVPPYKSVKRRLVALLYPPYQYCILHLLTSCLRIYKRSYRKKDQTFFKLSLTYVLRHNNAHCTNAQWAKTLFIELEDSEEGFGRD